MPQLSQAEVEEIHGQIVKLMDDTQKLSVASSTMTREIFWYPVAISVGLIGVVGTMTVLVVRLL